ncbi:MAG: LamG domain-containing protein [Prosthecobacter sp.]|uniref:LamG domain-containing protein n=1 Tax=Prosthecobacter sp. TaxID=1965333 RepID=UPI0025DBCD28|nr:LamG domain-containing protein [Prosthecobacter sp.]MCF7785853.1 LamG domain-containing protein [Prosthecobacter sp.]
MFQSVRSLFLLGLCFPWVAHSALQETWETGYAKEDATGPHVLGFWKFDEESKDVTLHGAVLNPKGKFGGALESFPGFPVEDQRHAAVVAVKPVKGAFTLEMWIKPKAAFEPRLRCFLLDKKYVDHTDYQWQLGDADKGGLRRMWVTLGFGAESKTIYSLPFKLEADVWQHVAFTYDGAGEGKFYRNGVAAGGAILAGYGKVTQGMKPLSIGDRLGSNYGGFPGLIDEVRVCEGVLSFERVSMQIVAGRNVWRRMETAKAVEIVCTNLRREVLKAAKLKVSLGGTTEEFLVSDLAMGKSFTAKYIFNTALKADEYELRARFEVGDYGTEQSAVLKLVPRVPERMPVIMWGANGEEMARLKDLGFTHFIGLGADYGEMWKQKKIAPPAKPEVIAKNRGMLDRALENGLEVIASLSPAHALESEEKNLRVGRDGKAYARQDICASLPDFASFFQVVGVSVGKAYGDHPAFTTALIDTEVRDNTQVSFNSVDVEGYRKFAGAEIPAEVSAKWGVDWTKMKDFPVDRVIADDHPILKYLRWFWTVGDGWNGLHTALHKGVRSSKVWTFFDPAVRQPSIGGAGGGVDVISHWTYTYPDPQKIGMCADQLFAMSAATGRNQRVMKMTQLIWYRSQTAPIGSKVPGEVVAWQDHDPEAAYITIAPMHLKEALWTKISRPIQGIMYHGWQSLVETGSPGGYRYTNSNTAPVLKQLLHEVIEPLGPSLMAIPDERSEVAFLESFTSQMFAHRGSYGSNTDWAADVWLALQHAHVQTDILFEETLLKNGLSGRKVLVMPYCDVLTKSVVTRIQDWQKKGGKIVADEFLCPALKADFLLPSFKRVKKADVDKAKVLEMAGTVGGFALPQKAMCDNPEIIVRTRKFGDATYVFVVNDKREFGNYVGQHGLVMENGVPSSGVVSLKAESANVYELTGTQFIVPKRSADGVMSWPVDLGPCDGRIFMVLPKPLLGLKLEVPENAVVGNSAKIVVSITTTQEAPTKAVIPVRVDVRDANGKAAEGSGFYAAENGIVEIKLDLAPNEDPGSWEVRVKELASGMEARKWMRVKRE